MNYYYKAIKTYLGLIKSIASRSTKFHCTAKCKPIKLCFRFEFTYLFSKTFRFVKLFISCFCSSEKSTRIKKVRQQKQFAVFLHEVQTVAGSDAQTESEVKFVQNKRMLLCT